jgi:WD40 repeat protein/class 3 adenylate cyclase
MAGEDPQAGGGAGSDDAQIRTFLIADVRGYTVFTQERGDEAAGRLAARFAQLTRESVQARSGTLLELRGDEALCVFASTRQAIRAAVDLQTRFIEETVTDPSLPLPVGIGLDAGEAVEVEGGYRGGALNLAARLCSGAGPGEILATQEVVHLARRVEGVAQIDRGAVRFKGMADPVRVLQLRPEGWDPAQDLAFQRALGPDAARLTPADTDLRVENPYKGLLPFEEADVETFFGREALTRELVARFADSRFLAVVGPSGSGKSSVVRAGLIPAIRGGAMPGSDRWPVVEMFPGAHPLIELETALLKVADDPPASLLQLLEADELGILRAIKRVLPPGDDQIVLFIDQLEEVFTLVEDESRRTRFLGGIEAVVKDPHSRVRVVTTLRADFYDRPLLYPGFADLMRSYIEPLVPLAPDELERAIVEPARLVGVDLEPGLMAEMLAEVADEPGALPLLQYALTELFQHREGTMLTVAAYRAIGGVSGALSSRAEELYGSLDDAAKEAARQLFLRLLTPGEGTEDARRRVSRAEIESIDVEQDAMATVLDRFGASRLLSFDRDARSHEPTVEVAHEALLRAWPRFRGWIVAAREDVRLDRRLGVAAAEWVDADRDPSFLLRGSQLGQFETWAAVGALALTANERGFLDASLEARRSEQEVEHVRVDRERALERRSIRRLRAVVAAVTVAALVAAGLTVVALDQRGEAQRQARVATARELAVASAANLEADPELSMLLALRSTEMTRSVDGTVLRDSEEALHAAVGTSRIVLSLRTPSSSAVSFSPDGSRLATAQRLGPTAGTVPDPVVWDTASGGAVFTLVGHTGALNDIQFSPRGDLIGTASEDGTAIIWDAETGEAQRSIRAAEEDEAAFNVVFSPDGRSVAITTSPRSSDRPDDEATIGVFEVATGDQVVAIPTSFTVCGIAFSPDGGQLVGGDCFGDVPGVGHLWDARTGREVGTVGSQNGFVTNVAISSDGGRVATAGGTDQNANVWDVDTGRRISTMVGHSGTVDQVAFSPNGRLLATGSSDGTARIWDVGSGQEVLELSGTRAAVGEVQFSPDGRLLATGGYDGVARLWDITTGGSREAMTLRVSGKFAKVAYSVDGSMLVAEVSSGIRVWDAGSGEELEFFPWDYPDFDPEADREVISSAPPVARDRASGELHVTYPRMPDLASTDYAADGSIIAAGAWSGAVALWDASSGRRIATLDPPTERLNAVLDLAFTPDGSLLVSTSWDGSAKMWDTTTHEQIGTLRHEDQVISVDINSEGSLIATTSKDGTARIWDLEGHQLQVLRGHEGAVNDVEFSPDGRHVATAGDDTTIRLWDITKGRETLMLKGHRASVFDLAFDRQGDRLASVSEDGTLRVSVLALDELIALAESRLTRTWTPEECRQYLRLDTCPPAP